MLLGVARDCCLRRSRWRSSRLGAGVSSFSGDSHGANLSSGSTGTGTIARHLTDIPYLT